MASLVLDPRLAGSFTISPASSTHLAEVYHLTVAEMSAVLGYCSDTEEDVRSWLEPPSEASSAQVLVRDKAGTLAQWWGALRAPGDPRFEMWVHTDSAVSEADGDELTRVGYQTMLAWVRDAAGTERSDDVLVHSGCIAGDESAWRRLQEAGFVHERTFWEMRGPVPEHASAATPVEGLTLRATEDQATVHQVINEGFAEHWAFEPSTFDDWLVLEEAAAGYDSELWFLAEIDGAPAAAMILSRRSAADRGLYIQEIATLKVYRHRGIASLLLRQAFDVARSEGYDHVVLHVDSDSTDRAPDVYRRAGLDVRHAFNACVLRLAPLGPTDSA
ncbi:MAG TPA: GNAT family N-acetyltransferase [Nocardioidaceae bacterium]|nr:GNAT family N-acetyltransferase [Nocardioidaceae bacterium]